MIVEIRSTGQQTVFPPSTHESGEGITWEFDGAEPAEIDPDELQDAVTRLANTVLVELGEKTAKKPKAAKQKKQREPEASLPEQQTTETVDP